MVGVTQVSSANSLLRRSEVTRCLMIMKSPIFSLCQHFTFLTTTSCISWWKIASNGHNLLPSLDSCPGNVSFVASFKKGVLILGPGLCLALNVNRHEALTDLQGACMMGPWTLIRPRHGPPTVKWDTRPSFPSCPSWHWANTQKLSLWLQTHKWSQLRAGWAHTRTAPLSQPRQLTCRITAYTAIRLSHHVWKGSFPGKK